uniref:DUF506 family protein n=1 Tax=Kalanchoe fedtschenkoi TaxID=63787 RepID=A0A7N1A0U9_KALFE
MERRVPARFGRVAEAFHEVAKLRPCESSGSEHSPDASLTDLSDLVNSFLERDDDCENGYKEDEDHQKVLNGADSDDLWSDSETRDELWSLMCRDSEDEQRMKIRNEVERAMGFDGVDVDKRKLMTRLRERGLDAGICKSKWEKTGRIPSGEFEYVDINMHNTRYIVELNLASHFEIARQAKGYAALLDIFPRIYVGKTEELKRLVRIMCAAIKASLKSVGMPVAPWRRNGYMQVKWFGAYKRTTNQVPAKVRPSAVENELRKRSVGFEFDASIPRQIVRGCRSEEQFGGKGPARLGNLAAAFAIDNLA